MARGRGTHHWLRVNLDLAGDDESFLRKCRVLWESGQLKYMAVSLMEVGTNEKLSSYQHKHRHVYFITSNSTTHLSIFNKLMLGGYGQYWYEENTKPESAGFRVAYLKKKESKPTWSEDNRVEMEFGQPPLERKRKVDGKNEPVADKWKARKKMAKEMDYKQILEQAGEDMGFWLSPYGKGLYSTMHRQVYTEMDPSIMKQNFIILGAPGTGKSLMCDAIRKKYHYFKWNGEGKWFSGYDPNFHQGLLMEEMDLDKLKCLGGGFNGGMQRLKAMSDGSDFQYEDKYGAINVSPPKPIIITTNHHVNTWSDSKTAMDDVRALIRRFQFVTPREFQEIKGLQYSKDQDKYFFIAD